MTCLTDAVPVTANAPGLPEGRQRLIELDDAIAKIRTQIATADLARQRHAKPIDPDWFHKARTALRHLCRERAEFLLQRNNRPSRDKVKDCLIGILRERHDPDEWASLLVEAHMRCEGEGA
ncbi:MAG: hypothetical protein WCJ41_17935 [Aestuariivirga sp.]|uniref:hypothetical protein n=1 Tax=Aestuariivirga sp. TaxID=2650926 RepID=UPI00301AC5C3